MKTLFKILFFVFAILQTNISEANFFIFDKAVSEIKFAVCNIENKNESTVISENDFCITCKSESDLVDSRNLVSSSEAYAAKTSTMALRQVGKYLESVDDVFANPNLLKGQSPLQVQGILGKTPGWQVEALGKGAHKGQGMILREYGTKGPTGRMIQWHPGGGHHGSNPYWKVSSGTGTVRIF